MVAPGKSFVGTVAGICIFSCAILYMSSGIYTSAFPLIYEQFSFTHRKLLNVTEIYLNTTLKVSQFHDEQNCTPPAIEQFPHPIMDYEIRRKGGLIIHVLLSLYMFLGLAIVCDHYFVPSLEKMCEVLNIQSDVAGATFMAAGSSAPELATAVIAVFVAKDDIGIGTVVGSAVYNIAFVIGICGLFAGRTIFLNWWPMLRDCVFYMISIIALLIAMNDEKITWWESLIFLLIYAMYIGFMFVNRKVEKWANSICCMDCTRYKNPDNSFAIPYKPVSETGGSSLAAENSLNKKLLSFPELNSLPPAPSDDDDGDDDDHDIPPPPPPMSPPSGIYQKALWIVSLPLIFICFVSIPDCRKPRWQSWFFVTFLVACLYISLFSYILVWMITIIGFTLNIKDTVMALTFLAAGVSVPDAIASLLVVKEGLGDMAVSNAVGSNVFDILLCLGLPWFLQTAIVNPGSTVVVRSRGLTYSTLTLLLTIVFLLVATHSNGWKLDRKYGLILLFWYAVFTVVTSLYELNIFGIVSLPTCSSNF